MLENQNGSAVKEQREEDEGKVYWWMFRVHKQDKNKNKIYFASETFFICTSVALQNAINIPNEDNGNGNQLL